MLAKALNVVGLMNVQYAIQRGVAYVLEVQPPRLAHGPLVRRRPPRLAKIAARCHGRASRSRSRRVREVGPPYSR